MTTNTTFLGLKTYNTTSDASAIFQTFRTDIAGVSPTSNMNLIDSFATTTTASLVALAANKPIYAVSGSYVSANYYEATNAAITAYATNMVISLTLNVTSSGAVTLNIGGLGTKSVQKIDENGNLANLANNELKKGREYLFRYNGTVWVWTDATSADQVSIAGSAGNIVMISPCGVLITSGSHVTTGVSSGSYNKVQVDTFGRVTSASVVAYQTVSDIAGSSIMSDTTGSSVKHNTSGAVAGTYNQVTVTTFGHVTSASNVLSSASQAGFIQTATAAQTTSGSIATIAVSPSSLAYSDYGKRIVEVALNGSTALAITDLAYFRVPAVMNNYNLVAVAAMCKANTSTSVVLPTFIIKKGSTAMLSTNITIDSGEYDSSTAATPAVINASQDDVQTGIQIEVSASPVGTGVTYAVVEMTFQKP